MDWIPSIIGFIGVIIVAIIAYLGVKKQIKTTIQTSSEQIKSSLEIAKLNLRGSIILEYHQKWLYEITDNISELLSKLQLIQDIIKPIAENKDDQNPGVQQELSHQIRRYIDLTERVQFLADKISLQLDDDKEHHKILYNMLYESVGFSVKVDFENPNYEKCRELNRTCYSAAKDFIKKEKQTLIKEL